MKHYTVNSKLKMNLLFLAAKSCSVGLLFLVKLLSTTRIGEIVLMNSPDTSIQRLVTRHFGVNADIRT